MKKLNKIVVSLALVLVLAMPIFLSGCFAEKPSDVELSAVYYHEDSSMGSGNDYVKFISDSYILMTVSDSADFDGKPAISITKTTASGKVIYLGSLQDGVNFTITVVDKNILTMHIVINGDSDNSTTFNLTKMA